MGVTTKVLHRPGAPQPWDMVQMHYEKPAPSVSLEKRGDGAIEAHMCDQLVSLSFAPAIPAPMYIFFWVHKEDLRHFRVIGGHLRRSRWDLPWLVPLCRNNTLLQRRRMELEQMQAWGSVTRYLLHGCKAA